jgi:oxalate decarboxylase/phosphoglucose isomerase-like protein (cupin superfamily)
MYFDPVSLSLLDFAKRSNYRSFPNGCFWRGLIPFYFMYRDLAKSDVDCQWLRSLKLRYDLTVIPSGSLCGECVKTRGHYHPRNPERIGYPEAYEILEGEAK